MQYVTPSIRLYWGYPIHPFHIAPDRGLYFQNYHPHSEGVCLILI